MQKKKRLTVLIGRFSIFHNGHYDLINRAILKSDKVLILIGSSFHSRKLKNPFTFEERREMINGSFPDVEILPIQDHINDDRWLSDVQSQIDSVAKVDDYEVYITGSTKDFDPNVPEEEKSQYLKWLKQRYKEDIIDPHLNINATDLRAKYFEHGPFSFSCKIPNSTLDFLIEFQMTQEYVNLSQEYEMIQKYKKSWEVTPYPVNFVTVDAVVVQSGHVLLVQRKEFPGKGLFAMPGGFLDPDERIKSACIRELREETGLKVPDRVLNGSIARIEVYDDPGRSSRGRTITNAFLFKLDDTMDLPYVKGSDDAEKAFWMPFSEIIQNKDKFFEDHYQILEDLLSL